jgi:hypothetical protein
MRTQLAGAGPHVARASMMRVQTTNSTGFATSSASARRAGGGTFTVGTADAPRSSAGIATPRGIGGIDALLALQAVDDIGERRRRAVRRGRTALDALDALKVGLLSGTLDAAALAKLKAVTKQADAPLNDAQLDGILAEIELRAEVELAKFERAEAAAGRT